VSRFIIEYQKGIDVRRNVFRSIATTNCAILDMQSGNETLEESFLKLTSQDQTKGGVK
jgi:ABC-2 type transport system ATP-binding protein